MNTEWMTHRGTRFLYVHFERCTSPAELMETLDSYYEIVKSAPGKFPVLVNFSDVTLDLEFLARTRQIARDVARGITKNAVLGIAGPKKLYYSTYAVMARPEDIGAFDTEEQALDWLAG